MMVNCLDLSLSLDLFGVPLFAPILVGPVADQRRFHPDGELATVRGASAGKAAVVVSNRSAHPLEAIAAAAATPLVFQAFAGDGAATVRLQAQDAERAGCRAILVTMDAPDTVARRPARLDWGAVDAVGGAVSVPVIVKGVMTASDAVTAVSRGAQGLVVSNYGRTPPRRDSPHRSTPWRRLSKPSARRFRCWSTAASAASSMRRKALAAGARAVLVARPVMWGLAAYGADGVQSVVELLQTDGAGPRDGLLRDAQAGHHLPQHRPRARRSAAGCLSSRARPGPRAPVRRRRRRADRGRRPRLASVEGLDAQVALRVTGHTYRAQRIAPGSAGAGTALRFRRWHRESCLLSRGGLGIVSRTPRRHVTWVTPPRLTLRVTAMTRRSTTRMHEPAIS